MKKIKILTSVIIILLMNFFSYYSNATLAPMSEISIKIINVNNEDYNISFKFKDNINEESLNEIKKIFNIKKENDEEKNIITFYYIGGYVSNSLDKLIIEDCKGNKKEFEIEYKNYEGFNQTTSIIAYEYDAETTNLIDKSQEIIDKYKIQDNKFNLNHYKKDIYKDSYIKDDFYILKASFLCLILGIIILILKILSKNNKISIINFLVIFFIIILNYLFYPNFTIFGIIIYIINLIYQIIKLKKINKLNINTISLLLCETLLVSIILDYNNKYIFIAA